MATYEPTRSPHKRGRGVYILIAFVTLFVAGVASFAFAIDRKPLNNFDHYDRPTYVSAADPISAALKGVPPTTTVQQTAVASVAIRTIDVRTNGVALIAGGRQVRFIKHPGVADVASLAAVVADSSWIRRVDVSTVRLYAALIVERDVKFMVGGIATKTVQLVNLPGVFIGAKQATLNFAGVHVTAITEQGTPASAGVKSDQFRPFVVADERSTMNASEATFTGLGYDWNASYGVSWMDGSTGTSTESVYEDGFIGVYTDHAYNVNFTGDTYRGNTLYGIDPHSASTELDINGCLAEGNGAHGIIFSDHVAHSRVKGCTSRNNGENGIMMDFKSESNIIEGNSVITNHGDGVVLSDSPANLVTNNTIRGNRVGVQIPDGDKFDYVPLNVTGNIISDNALAVQGFDLDSQNAEHGNGGQWNIPRATIVCAAVLLIGLLWLIATIRLRRNRGTAKMTRLVVGGPAPTM